MTKLKEIMEKRMITDTALSKLSGVSRQTIYRIRLGKSKGQFESLTKIATALKKKVEDIV